MRKTVTKQKKKKPSDNTSLCYATNEIQIVIGIVSDHGQAVTTK